MLYSVSVGKRIIMMISNTRDIVLYNVLAG